MIKQNRRSWGAGGLLNLVCFLNEQDSIHTGRAAENDENKNDYAVRKDLHLKFLYYFPKWEFKPEGNLRLCNSNT